MSIRRTRPSRRPYLTEEQRRTRLAVLRERQRAQVVADVRRLSVVQ